MMDAKPVFQVLLHLLFLLFCKWGSVFQREEGPQTARVSLEAAWWNQKYCLPLSEIKKRKRCNHIGNETLRLLLRKDCGLQQKATKTFNFR
ncbi:hypothetical protein Pyn_12434 [Prunus yedoensis var. nudiflora]|uniref:Secreted protein n=1 Tax=Prunus yedoensis var. nudiflora TaxID=2094558 RepID=A0A315AT67_PRUYE|nr:hypothetical protein Pyn_12434 [Prunus yedoensis var. nudiflora]